MKHSLLLAMAVLPMMLPAQQRSASIARVYDYCPAPGQFINTLPKGDTHEAQVHAADSLLRQTSGMICLGAFGGYVVFGWDHPIVNVEGQKDFKITGNAYTNNNEAGIVMVSVDRNGNGVPDDEWYELAGSEYRAEGTLHHFSVTYYRPDDELNAAGYAWRSNDPDSLSGMVRRNNFHKQSYWPAGVEADSITFTGTRLPFYAHKNGSTWVLPQFDNGYGYADHWAAADDPGLDIDWAVNQDGSPVRLDHIDFVKVYTGSLQDCGMIGETSTEISCGEDLHVDAELDTQAPMAVASFDNVTLPQGSQWWNHGTYDEDESLVNSVFTSGDWQFNNQYMPDYDSWMFFGVSSTTINDFEGYQTGQYNSACGGSHSGSQFGILYGDAMMGISKASLIARGDKAVPGVFLTNDAWNVDCYLNGDGMGGEAFKAGDWFKVTITGLTQAKVDAGEKDGPSVEVYLADYRSDDAAKHTYLRDWTWVDLSPLGQVHELRFAFDGSRKNSWGLTTPSYMCLDDLGATGDLSGIEGLTSGSSATAVVTGRYDLQGRPVTASYRGLVIERLSDGTARKALQ